MFHRHYSYRATLEASERVAWRVEDLIGEDKRLDFGRPFLPERLAGAQALTFLSPQERLRLNQIRGHGYLCMFGTVEEFILPFVLDHARTRLDADDYRVRALLNFAAEEAKHIHLFRRFRAEFERSFGTPCGAIGPAEAIGKAVLAHHPLSVALAILHIEWMTQAHYLDSVKDDEGLDPVFSGLLKHHWMEEAQHAKLDTLMVEALAESCGPQELAQAVDGYLEIGAFIDGGLGQQVALDASALQAACGRALSAPELEAFETAQRQSQRRTFLGSGMAHPNFLATLEGLDPSFRGRIEETAKAFN